MHTLKILIATALLPLTVLAQYVPAAKEQKKTYPKTVSHSPQVVIYCFEDTKWLYSDGRFQPVLRSGGQGAAQSCNPNEKE